LGLEVIRERCAGIDVHKRQVTVCARVPSRQELRVFATDTESLLAMVDWLQDQWIDDVAMEATGSYWKPVYNLLNARSSDQAQGAVESAGLGRRAATGMRPEVRAGGWGLFGPRREAADPRGRRGGVAFGAGRAGVR
jgi:hypothetical protein